MFSSTQGCSKEKDKKTNSFWTSKLTINLLKSFSMDTSIHAIHTALKMGMLRTIWYPRSTSVFSPIDTSASFCGDITHLGLPFCLARYAKEPCWGLFYFSFLSMIFQEILCHIQNLFANDMKVYRVLRDTKEDIEEPQKDLTRLEYFKQSFFIRISGKMSQRKCWGAKFELFSRQKFYFRPQGPKYCPIIFKNKGKFFEKIKIWQSYTQFSSDVEVNLSDLIITLSRND